MNAVRTLLAIVAIFLPIFLSAQTPDTLCIATYNSLNFNSSSALRDPAFRMVLRAIDPDILVVQEIGGVSGMTAFLMNALNAGGHGTYAAAPLIPGPDTQNAMFYKLSRVSFIGPVTVLHTHLRDIDGYRLRPKGINADTLDIQIFSAHLKSSQGYGLERAAEAEVLRTYLNTQSAGYFVAAGDFNLYGNNEGTYRVLTGDRVDNRGPFYDPLGLAGAWHDDATFAKIHTQSTRGGSGGLDDRFDFVLLSDYFEHKGGWGYLPGSYTAYGNDGHHLNQSINALPNSAVPDSIANALSVASDHLPVYLRLIRDSLDRRDVQP